MPIRAEFRKFYGREWKLYIRPAILRRAGGRFDEQGKYLGGACCEQCGKPDREEVWTFTWKDAAGPNMVWCLSDSIIRQWRDARGQFFVGSRPPGAELREIVVQIGIAHRNHNPSDNRPANLRAWCNWCHLNFDAQKHRETRIQNKDLARPMLAIAEGQTPVLVQAARRRIRKHRVPHPFPTKRMA